ncbi:septal ring lytic transglycosylase RlpA family protein [Methylomarinum vadi]|uniref:septal ring lytic transglycosylase RlpA family protein n=1 Tax=Methylomarinum vadi TaxID=438855 RepID=UPI0004DFB6F1|nr:septal ring lytic transglycosylase RlpA family protein [Methylomarinum vadi]
MKNRVLCFAFIIVNGCSIDPLVKDSAPDTVPVDIMAIPDAVPRYEKRTRAGNPGTYEVLGQRYQVLVDSNGYRKRGIASWYGKKFHGRKTANGEIYNMFAMTAAHRTLPIPSYVRVTNLKNQRSVVVRINDRGPFHDNRIIDLSYAAAVKLGVQQAGTGFVEVVALDPSSQPAAKLAQKPEVNPDEKLYLQIGAFSNQFNARQLQQKVAQIPLAAARLKVAQHQGDTVYKVQLGPVASVEMADRLNEQLVAMGVTSSTLVSDN